MREISPKSEHRYSRDLADPNFNKTSQIDLTLTQNIL